jgi:hypothetical protein
MKLAGKITASSNFTLLNFRKRFNSLRQKLSLKIVS